jgi:hypothetical protein
MRMVVTRFLAACIVLGGSAMPLSLPASADSASGTSAALQQHIARGADIVQAIHAGRLHKAAISAPNSGSVCPAEPSSTGNVQVNCRAEDAAYPPSAQNETTVSADGSKVVVGFNDDLVCCDQLNFSGYSVSTNGGRTFTDMGDVPWSADVQPIGDPSIVHDDHANFYYASLALSSGDALTPPNSLISVYEMKAGSNTFHLLSVPVNVGRSDVFFADKELLEIARDGRGKRHFYLTWTYYQNNSMNRGAVMLTDSTDGIHWRTVQVSPGIPCQPLSPAAHPVPAGNTVYVSYIEMDLAACGNSPNFNGHQTMVTVDVPSGHRTAVTTIAPVHGAGDVVQFCGQGLLQVIHTGEGQNVRSPELPSSAADENGTLYDIWADRPEGIGGGNSNATRIYLSYSLDGNASWSTPQVISGAIAPNFMNDRFQPWLVADGDGLHAMWYERVLAPSGGPDWLRTDKIDLSLATSRRGPRAINGGETALSAVPFPVIDTGGGCYMGDYNQIASNGDKRFVTWGDNRNTFSTAAGPVNQPDVFMAAYGNNNGGDNGGNNGGN